MATFSASTSTTPSPSAPTLLAPSDKQTTGLLRRRHVTIGGLRFIGKESNRLEEVEQGLSTVEDGPYVDYPDPRRDEWATVVLPVLRAMPLEKLQRLSGLSRAALQAIRAGRRPHAKNRAERDHDMLPCSPRRPSLIDRRPEYAIRRRS
jgi:hypothetical protein